MLITLFGVIFPTCFLGESGLVLGSFQDETRSFSARDIHGNSDMLTDLGPDSSDPDFFLIWRKIACMAKRRISSYTFHGPVLFQALFP